MSTLKKRLLSLFLALALCMGLSAVPASAANSSRALSTDFSKLKIYDVVEGTHTLRDRYASVIVLVIGRVNNSNTTGRVREVLNMFKTMNISNGHVYLLDVDQSEETVRSYAQRDSSGAHFAWRNGTQTYVDLFWEITEAVEPGATSAGFPALCVLNRSKPIYCSSPRTHDTAALSSALAPYAVPTQPIPSQPAVGEPAQTNKAEAQRIYQAMAALKDLYPEDAPWTNANFYSWKGGIYSGGYGSEGFAFMLSDAAFGALPARKVRDFAFSDVRVGDILRIDNDSHSVIVLEVHDGNVVAAEGNHNRSVRWGRTMTAARVESADYLLTRYPETIPAVSFTDVPGWCSDPVSWAVYNKITQGVATDRFAPETECSNAMILTFLWRAAGSPNVFNRAPISMSGDEYYAKAVNWAYSRGIINSSFDPAALCTRLSAIMYIWKAVDGSSYNIGASFSDIDSISVHGRWAVHWAVQNGITNGTSAATFSPDKVCSRGEIITFLYRAYVPSARLK